MVPYLIIAFIVDIFFLRTTIELSARWIVVSGEAHQHTQERLGLTQKCTKKVRQSAVSFFDFLFRAWSPSFFFDDVMSKK